MKHTSNTPKGFSLVEVIVTIAIIGILSSIATVSVSRVTERARSSFASNVIQALNNGTKEFGHAQWTLSSDSENNNSLDEIHILKTIQWEDPTIDIGVNGPFMRPDWAPDGSDSNEDYRAVWSGNYWRLVEPGEDGAGLKIVFDGSDTGDRDRIPADFEPVNESASNLDG